MLVFEDLFFSMNDAGTFCSEDVLMTSVEHEHRHGADWQNVSRLPYVADMNNTTSACCLHLADCSRYNSTV